MKDEVEESDVDDLLQRYLEEERQHTSEQFEGQARATFQRLVEEAQTRRLGQLGRINFHEAIRLLRRLLSATADRPGVLAKMLGYRENKNDAEHRAMMRAVEFLHNDPLPVGSIGGRPPSGRGHRFSPDTETCMLCGVPGSMEKGWRTDCPKNPPQRVRSKETCAVAVAEAAQKAGITNAKGQPLDSEAVLKMYNRWRQHGSPREREHERLLRSTQQ